MTGYWARPSSLIAVEPGPRDQFVVMFVEGRRRLVRPVTDYEAIHTTAQTLADAIKLPVKVLPFTLKELLTLMGITPAEFVASIAPENDAEFRKLGIAACMDALRESGDPSIRAEALEALVKMEVMKQ